MFLIRPNPNSTESLQGYTFRLARANGYRLSQLSSFVSSKSVRFRSFRPEDRVVIKACLVAMTGHTSVNNLFDPWQHHQKHKELFDYKRIKVCSSCVSTSSRTHFLWWFKNYLVCHDHQEILIEKCSKCFTALTEQALVAMQCTKCNTLISEMQSETQQPDKLTLYIKDHLDAVNVVDIECALNKILDRILALKPYVRLIPGEMFRTWHHPEINEASINKLVDIQSNAMALFKNREHTKKSLLNRISQDKDKLSISAKMHDFSSYLSHPNNTQFKTDLADTLRTNAKKLDSFDIELTWLEKVYGIERSKIRSLLDSIDPSILNGKARLNSKCLYILSDLIDDKS
jgi:hypothetical protein